MIRLREFMADPEVFLSAEVQGLRAHLFRLFVVVYFATDGAGRFRADAAVLRAVLFAHTLQQVSARDVQAWLVELHERGLVKLYAEEGVGFGKVMEKYWRQRDTRRKVIHPDERPPDAGELPLGVDPPPKGATARSKQNRRESECETPDAFSDLGPPPFKRTHTHTPRKTANLSSLDPKALDEYLDLLAVRFSGVNIRAEITRATAYVRRMRGASAKLTLKFFEEDWLPRAGGPSLSDSAPIERIPEEPEYWREMVNDEFPTSDYARGGTKEGTPWADLDADVRRHFLGMLPGWLKRTGRSAA